MKMKDSVKGILLLMVVEQAAFALPPTISDFCLAHIKRIDKQKAKEKGNPIEETGVSEENSLWLTERKYADTSGPRFEYRLKGLTPTFQEGNLITYDVDLVKQVPNKTKAPRTLDTMAISLKLNDKGIVDSIEAFNGIKTDTRKNIENRLSLENRHIALLIADFISTGGKYVLEHAHSSIAITLKDERPNKQNPIAKRFNPEFPKAPHQ